MRMSRHFGATLRTDPTDAGPPGHRLLMRAGYVRASAPGLFSYLPLGRRALAKIEAAARAEMESIGAQEVGLPIVQAMASEEQAAILAASEVASYRQLPAVIYQIQKTVRDEARPRGGLLRARESLRLTSYGFARAREGREELHEQHRRAFQRLLARLELRETLLAEAALGLTEERAEEIILRGAAGDARVATCGSCGYLATLEAARFDRPQPPREAPLPMEKVATPGADTIEALAAYLGVPASRTAKVVFFSAGLAHPTADAKLAREVVVMALVRGDMEASEAKLRQAMGAVWLRPADAAAIRSVGAVAGYASPVGLESGGLRIVVDELVAATPNLVSGANAEGYHLLNVCYGRDYGAQQVADIAQAFAGAGCPRCAAPLEVHDGVEVARLRGFAAEFSQALGATYQGRDGSVQPTWMGAYDLELDRLLACVAEGHHDEHGLALPASVAPYAIHLIALGGDAAVGESADRLYAELRAAGLEVLYDDRDVSGGVKFNDADLIGIPLRVTVSARGLEADSVELKLRSATERLPVPGSDAVSRAGELIARLRS